MPILLGETFLNYRPLSHKIWLKNSLKRNIKISTKIINCAAQSSLLVAHTKMDKTKQDNYDLWVSFILYWAWENAWNFPGGTHILPAKIKINKIKQNICLLLHGMYVCKTNWNSNCNCTHSFSSLLQQNERAFFYICLNLHNGKSTAPRFCTNNYQLEEMGLKTIPKRKKVYFLVFFNIIK